MKLSDCHNSTDFRRLAQRRLPAPVFHYIDGGADDEITLRRNTEAFKSCDLVPDVLAGIETVDLRTTVLGREIAMPIFLSPTALQRLFHWQGERAVAAAAAEAGTFFGLSSIATVSIEDIARLSTGPKLFQLYVHKDQGLNDEMFARAKTSGFDALALTFDTAAGGNRERDLRTGFTSPPRNTAGSFLSYATHPRWVLDYLLREHFELANLKDHVAAGTFKPSSIGDYIDKLLDPLLDWKKAEALRVLWNGTFCLKGIMSIADARRAVDIGANAIMVSNHGGRQLDGSRAPPDHAEIVDAVGDKVDVICDGGIRRHPCPQGIERRRRLLRAGRIPHALAAAGRRVERADAMRPSRSRHEADGHAQHRRAVARSVPGDSWRGSATRRFDHAATGGCSVRIVG